MNSKYSIKELEHLSGIKAHTIRAWESRYNLIEPSRTDTNIRYYTDKDLKKLLNVAVLVQSGVRISKVAGMSDAEIREAVINSGNYETNYGAYVSALKSAMMDYDPYAFDSVISRCLIKYGAEKTLLNIVGGFIKEIGRLWQVGSIKVSHEHFASNMIKMKLFTLVDQGMGERPSTDADSYILYLPSNELHELSLLFLYYTIINQGDRAIYLGQDVPMEYLSQVTEKTGIKSFVSVFTTSPHYTVVPEYVQQIGELFPGDDYRFYITGRQCGENLKEVKRSGIQVFETFNEMFRKLKK